MTTSDDSKQKADSDDKNESKGGKEGIGETVRTVVNDSGLGNPPPESRRRPQQVRRFERSCPNAMWQIDIFTFTNGQAPRFCSL